MSIQPLAITAGEPAGIGFDIILQSASKLTDCIIIADTQELINRAQLLNIDVELCEHTPKTPMQLRVKHVPVTAKVACGQLNTHNAKYVLACLDEALRGISTNEYSAIVTAPLHKGVINDAGIPFTGHTEYLAAHTNSEVVMLLVADQVRVALATTHLPLSQVPQAITPELIHKVVTILHQDLISKFGIDKPRIGVCGLNPHAGEQGHLGKEEIEIIDPALTKLKNSGINVTGPFPADTIFTPKQLQLVDAVLAMYHDQGLPTLKHIGFGNAVNTTLGLPIVRTSVDHGTALDLAGTGKSDAGSLLAAVDLARIQVNIKKQPIK
ncbi:MAG: 4-hydroxythreonine-4-phosphate dehydrogenase PdxA [Gammaproteobacteria bacterium]